MAGLRIAIFSILALVPMGQASHAAIRTGYYKIESVQDSSALTATWNGRPREVVTDTWQEMSVQEWKIRAVEGGPLEIIRNENVKDNEVSKQDGVPSHWTFTRIGNVENTFTLSNDNGQNCLKNNGLGQRISFVPCNSQSQDQQWRFIFLFSNL